MDLKELRDKIFECAGNKSVLEFKDHLSLSDYSDIEYYEKELQSLYGLLEKQHYYYVEEILEESAHKCYLDSHLWHSSVPQPFISEEEALETIKLADEREIERYGKPMYARTIKEHFPAE